MTDVTDKSDEELVSHLEQVRDNIEMNVKAGMVESLSVNINEE